MSATFIQNPDFSQYEEISRPCAERESRVFRKAGGDGVCYRAYQLALARESFGMRGSGAGKGLVILIEHGGGREVLRLGSIYGVESDWILQITDERRLYAALWTLYHTAAEARTIAEQLTANKYAQAFAEGRLKKRRRNRRVYVEIEAPAVALQVPADTA